MIRGIGQQLKGRKIALKGAFALAVSILTIGLLVGSGPEPLEPSKARGIDSVAAATVDFEPSDEKVTLADLAEKLALSVVNIQATKIEKTGIQGFQIPNGPYGDFFDRYFGRMPEEGEPRRREGAGSGVVISEDGYLLTNHHVIDGATRVIAVFSDKKEFEAEIVGSDPKTDLAVLKVKGKESFHAAALGDSDALRVGESVIAIGNPFGLSHTVTKGIVSAKGRVIGAGPYDDFIQTDASINPGNSGGPLFNTKGEVVGINTAIIPNGQGIGFAVPINTAKPLVPQLIDHGKVTRGYLGVTIQPVTKDLARALDLEENHGALVSDVVPGGPADDGGIESGDVILSFNGDKVEESHDLPAMVANTPVGEEADVRVVRKGKERTLKIHIAELDSNSRQRTGSSRKDKTEWGLQLQNLTPQLSRQLGLENAEGVLIADVQPDSPADRAGLKRGDVILEVNQTPVSSAQEVASEFREDDDDSLLLTVKRSEGRLFVALDKHESDRG